MRLLNKTGNAVARVIAASALLLSACQVVPYNCCNAPTFQSRRFVAVGYGSVGGSNSQYTVGQQKVMAMRAARVDAFRALAEQVYGFRISGATSVSAFATHNDNMRTYVDAFVRGAQVVSMTAVSDGNFEATVELEMTPEFFSCMSNVYTCSYITTVQHDPYCSYSGCVQPNSYYYRNY